MNSVITAFREKWPAYNGVPDDDLTAAIAGQYPAYLDVADFRQDFERITPQTFAVGERRQPAVKEVFKVEANQPEATPETDWTNPASTRTIPVDQSGEQAAMRQRASATGATVLEDMASVDQVMGPPIPTVTAQDLMPVLPPRAAQIVAGLNQGATALVDAVRTPAVGIGIAAGVASPALARAVPAAFFGEMARGVPQQAATAYTAFQEGDLETGTRDAVGAVAGAAMLPALAGSALGIIPKQLRQSGAPVTAQVLSETLKTTQREVPRETEINKPVEQPATEVAKPVTESGQPKAPDRAISGEGQVLPTPSRGAEVAEGAIATSGPLSTLPPVANAPVPKGLHTIIQDIAKELDVPVRFGRLTTRKFAGYYKPFSDLIGSKKANDIVTVTHEAGHKIDDLLSIRSKPEFSGELMLLGDNARPGSRSSWTPKKSVDYRLGEGVAEFVRYYVTEPVEAAKLAPKFSADFPALLETSRPELRAMLDQAQSDVQTWRQADPQMRLRSHILVGETRNAPYTLDHLVRDTVNDYHFLKLAEDAAKEVKADLLPTKSPHLLAQSLPGAFGVADSFITRGAVNFSTRDVNPSVTFAKALEPVRGRIKDFRDWITAKQAQEMHAKGQETGLVPADVDVTVSKFQGDPVFNKAFQDLKQWSDTVLQYAVDSGYLSADSATAMLKMWQDYVPMSRLFEVGAGEVVATGASAGGRGLNQVGKAFKGRKGSPRPIVDPLETWIKNTYAIISNSEKNLVNLAVADLSNIKGMGKYVEKIPVPKQMERIGVEKLREELEANGADLSAVPDDLLLTFWKDSKFAPSGENIIKVNRAGKLEFYRLESELYKTLQALDFDTAGRLVRALGQISQMLRAGVTLTPDFAMMNALRDGVSTAVVSRYGTVPFESTIRGFAAMINNPKLADQWAASLGKQSIEANYFDRAKLQEFMREKITKDLTPAEQALVVVKSPLVALRWLTGKFEEATRQGEYGKGVEVETGRGLPIGEARRKAAFESRDLQNFAQKGAKLAVLKRLTAFFGSAVSGNYRLWQAFKENPVGTLARGLGYITSAKILEFTLNQDDPDYWDRPQWERDLFFMIPIDKDERGHTQFLRIPTPFLPGVLFGTLPGRILEWAKTNDPEAVKGLTELVFKQTFPNPVPQAAVTAAELIAGDQGYSFFRDRPIVPSSLKDKPPEMQFTEQSSLTGRKVGESLEVSPMKVDYAIRGFTGGLGSQVTHEIVDRAIELWTDEKRTAKRTVPGSRFLSGPYGIASESVNDFYERLDTLRKEAVRFKETGKTDWPIGELAGMERDADTISKLRKAMRDSKDDGTKAQIAERIVQIAARWKRTAPSRAQPAR